MTKARKFSPLRTCFGSTSSWKEEEKVFGIIYESKESSERDSNELNIGHSVSIEEGI